MLASSTPIKMPVAWASGAGAGYVRVVPIPSQPQTGSTLGYASFTDGFPPPNFVNPNAGGVPPWGSDFNGVFQAITLWEQWWQAGAPIYYDATFSGAVSGVNGYPHGALINAVGIDGGYWFSTVDNNTSDPDTGGANWLFCQISQAALDARYIVRAPNATVYVETVANGGNDSTGDGTSAAPWATPAHAVAVVSQYAANQVQVNIGTLGGGGTWTIPSGQYGALVPKCLVQNWIFNGNSATTPNQTLIDASATGSRGISTLGPTVTVQNLAVKAYYQGFFANANGLMVLTGTVAFIGTSATTSVAVASNNNSQINCLGTLNLSGNMEAIASADKQGLISFGYSDVNTSNNFVGTILSSFTVNGGSLLANQISSMNMFNGHASWVFIGGATVTGSRFSVNLNSTVNSSGLGTSWPPGSTAGTQTNGGIYT
jgi:hypothetical protein